jgi:hypothetical protein
MNAVFLPDIGWYRLDARGNRHGLTTEFTPPTEVFAFRPNLPGEATFKTVWPEPLPVVVTALQAANSLAELLSKLPDWDARDL